VTSAWFQITDASNDAVGSARDVQVIATLLIAFPPQKIPPPPTPPCPPQGNLHAVWLVEVRREEGRSCCWVDAVCAFTTVKTEPHFAIGVENEKVSQ